MSGTFNEVMAASEIGYMTSAYGDILTASKDLESKNGPGALVLHMDPTKPGVPILWQRLEKIPEAQLAAMVGGKANVGGGSLAVIFVHPVRVAAYILNTNTGLGWRAVAGTPFAITDKFIVNLEGVDEQPGRPARPLYRAEDIEDDNDDLW